MATVTASSLIASYQNARKTIHGLHSWKKSLTTYANRRSIETGSEPYRYTAAIKAQLARKGQYID